MKKNSTLISSDAETLSVKVNSTSKLVELSPKQDTIDRLRRLARVAFSDATLAGMPIIILN